MLNVSINEINQRIQEAVANVDKARLNADTTLTVDIMASMIRILGPEIPNQIKFAYAVSQMVGEKRVAALTVASILTHPQACEVPMSTRLHNAVVWVTDNTEMNDIEARAFIRPIAEAHGIRVSVSY